MNFRDEKRKKTEEIEQILKAYLPVQEGKQQVIMEAMEYSLMAGGKRLRPMLLWETFQMFGGAAKTVRPFMAAIEMIHTYSLVHDDLPAMDNDEYRRGKKTTHVVYGEAMAILAGDALLNLAYETASQAFDLEPGNPTVGKAFQILSAKTGMTGMIGGQSVDVEYVDRPLSAEQLQFIYDEVPSEAHEIEDILAVAHKRDEEIAKARETAQYAGDADPYKHPEERDDDEFDDDDEYDEYADDLDDDDVEGNGIGVETLEDDAENAADEATGDR